MKNLKSIGYVLGITLCLLIAIEILAKYTIFNIYNRTFDKSLIQTHKYGITDGLKPNAHGIVWGKLLHTDDIGARAYPNPKPNKPKLLIMGDSVTEGVGVDDSSTFAALCAPAIDSLAVSNISLIGWSIKDYNNVLHSLLNMQNGTPIHTLWLFYCLNDIYGDSKASGLPTMGHKGLLSYINALLQHRYATYTLLKLFLYQHSDYYYQYDSQFYSNSQKVNLLLADLTAMDSLCTARGIQFKLFILPYRSQLSDAKNNAPQQVMAHALSAHHISFLDLLPTLATATNPEKLYLFADEIHLSPMGHLMVADALCHNAGR